MKADKNPLIAVVIGVGKMLLCSKGNNLQWLNPMDVGIWGRQKLALRCTEQCRLLTAC